MEATTYYTQELEYDYPFSTIPGRVTQWEIMGFSNMKWIEKPAYHGTLRHPKIS
jgi:hypothetical protein